MKWFEIAIKSIKKRTGQKQQQWRTPMQARLTNLDKCKQCEAKGAVATYSMECDLCENVVMSIYCIDNKQYVICPQTIDDINKRIIIIKDLKKAGIYPEY